MSVEVHEMVNQFNGICRHRFPGASLIVGVATADGYITFSHLGSPLIVISLTELIKSEVVRIFKEELASEHKGEN